MRGEGELREKREEESKERRVGEERSEMKLDQME